MIVDRRSGMRPGSDCAVGLRGRSPSVSPGRIGPDVGRIQVLSSVWSNRVRHAKSKPDVREPKIFPRAFGPRGVGPWGSTPLGVNFPSGFLNPDGCTPGSHPGFIPSGGQPLGQTPRSCSRPHPSLREISPLVVGPLGSHSGVCPSLPFGIHSAIGSCS